MFGSLNLDKSRLLERYAWLGCCILSLSIAFALLLISWELPPMLIKPWVVIGIQILLAAIVLRLLIYIALSVSVISEGRATLLGRSGAESVWKVVNRLVYLVGTALLLLAAFWLEPFWLHPWKWRILQALALTLVALSFVRFATSFLAFYLLKKEADRNAQATERAKF